MAATYGRLTGKAGVCLSTLGPGATNLVTAAAYAQLGAMPMLMLTGQKPIKSSKQGHFQIVDVVDMMQPLTKYTHQIVRLAGHRVGDCRMNIAKSNSGFREIPGSILGNLFPAFSGHLYTRKTCTVKDGSTIAEDHQRRALGRPRTNILVQQCPHFIDLTPCKGPK